MRNTIDNLFDNHSVGVAVILFLLYIAVIFAFSFGFYTLAIWLASKCFGFAFKWIYVFGLWMAVAILKTIFKTRNTEVD